MSDIMDSIIDRDTILIVIAIVLVMIIGWFIGTLNRLRKYRVIIKSRRKTLILRSLKDMTRFAKCSKLHSHLQNMKKQH